MNLDELPIDSQAVRSGRPALKKIPPYWYPYRTNAKARWFDREILEVISTEFRDRSVEYYRYALQSGVTTINGKIALPGTIIRNGDTLENIVHRHEPPVTSTPVEILHHDKDRGFIVINKPGSILDQPVHAAGRYFRNSLVEILKNDFGFKNVHTVNRLDRLTSGLMIIALSSDCARTLTAEFTSGTIRKEYIARVRGEFPAHEIICEEPLLTVDRQMGLNIVHPEGKEAKTIFKRLHYDEGTDTSVVHCRPFTGRSHQIRVHLQYLGHPIANDAVYADTRIWGSKLGVGGIDFTPSGDREAPRPPTPLRDSTAEGRGRGLDVHAQVNGETESEVTAPIKDDALAEAITPTSHSDNSDTGEETVSPISSHNALRKKKKKMRENNPAFRTKEESAVLRKTLVSEASPLLPRETGHDIGLGSPIPLSSEAVGIIMRMRNQKDEDEDWSRWRDVVFRARGSLVPRDFTQSYAEQRPVPKRKAKRGKSIRPQNKSVGNGGEETNTSPSTASAMGAVDRNQFVESLRHLDEAPAIVSEQDKYGHLTVLAQSDVITSNGDGNETAIKGVGSGAYTSQLDSLALSNLHLHDDQPKSASDIAQTPTTSLDPDPVIGYSSQKPIMPADVLSHAQESEEVGASGTVAAADEASSGAPLSIAETEDDREALYCPECYLPLHPDPKPEKLYIFLHALRYTSPSLGAFETTLPEWAAEGYTWE